MIQTCRFIAVDAWEVGVPPYCGAPLLSGSPYCVDHHRLCYLAPSDAAALELALARELLLSLPRRRLKCLGTAPLPECEEDETSVTLDEFFRDNSVALFLGEDR